MGCWGGAIESTPPNVYDSLAALIAAAALLRNGSKSVRWIFGSFLEELKKSKKRGAQDLFVLFAATERAHAAARRPQVHDGGQLSPWNHSN